MASGCNELASLFAQLLVLAVAVAIASQFISLAALLAMPRVIEPFTFGEKKDQIDPDNLTLVAFVQDEKTKAILQTTSMKLKRQVASSNNQEQYGMEAR